MPPFPEKQSPLLVRLKQKKPLMEAEGASEPPTPSTSTTHTEDRPKLTDTTVNIFTKKNIIVFSSCQIHLNQQQQQNGLLVSLDIESNGHNDQSTSLFSLPSTSPYSLPSQSTTLQSTKKFLFKNSDIIFENDIIQIGIKGEALKSVLRVEFYYGNKTNFTLTNVSTNITLVDELEPGKTKILFK